MNIISQEKALLLLRFALGVTFLWFGVLKLFNASSVIPLIKTALPITSDIPLFFLALALIEILIGLAFLANRFVKIAALVMIVHLLVATLSVLFTQGFDPWFPVLSLPGEFVVKNLVLMAAGLLLLTKV